MDLMDVSSVPEKNLSWVMLVAKMHRWKATFFLSLSSRLLFAISPIVHNVCYCGFYQFDFLLIPSRVSASFTFLRIEGRVEIDATNYLIPRYSEQS